MKGHVCMIIPAWNAQETITEIVTTLLASEYVHEVIVISDGSTDETALRARAAGAVVYEKKRPQGRGQAMLYGASKTQADILGFMDADVFGLTLDHIDRLVLPVLSGARVMNIGIRDHGVWYAVFARFFPMIGTERAMRRDVFERIHPEFLQGHKAELALNYACGVHRLTYGAVLLTGLHVRTPIEKLGYVKGVIQYIRMAIEVIQAHLAIRIAKLLGKF